MTIRWKNLTDVFTKTPNSGTSPQSLTLKERLEQEKDKLRAEAEARRKGGSVAVSASDEQELQKDLRALRALLGWKLDVRREVVEAVSGNPSKVDGYWFGVRRYTKWAKTPDEQDETCWTLHFFRACPHCKFLFPTLQLGDYAEILLAAKDMMGGKDAEVARSTHRLASYLNDLDANLLDPHCPRQCPSCKKLIRGGTL